MQALRIFCIGTGSLHDDGWVALCREAGAAVALYLLDGHRTLLRGADFDIAWQGDTSGRGGAAPVVDTAARRQALDRMKQAIQAFQPDVVHAFGMDPAGYFTADAMAQSNTPFVLQIRGGPEIGLYGQEPAAVARMRDVLARCDGLIADNDVNLEFAASHGLREDVRRRCIGAVPGGGGLSPADMVAPSDDATRAPLVLWPKAYANPSVDGYAIADGLRLAFQRAPELQVRLLFAHQPDFLRWLRGHWPAGLLARARIAGFVPRPAVLDALREAHVMLAPSLLDGVPNVMLESMACGALPVVSPHATLPARFLHAPSIGYASNLDATQIADAIVQRLQAQASSVREWRAANRELALSHATRAHVAAKVASLYLGIAGHGASPRAVP
jgi:hypothetical protein